jgi:hypothetical protein
MPGNLQIDAAILPTFSERGLDALECLDHDIAFANQTENRIISASIIVRSSVADLIAARKLWFVVAKLVRERPPWRKPKHLGGYSHQLVHPNLSAWHAVARVIYHCTRKREEQS